MPRRSRKPAPECRPEEAAFLQSIVDNPRDEGQWLILADWLEENDDPRRAELLRLHWQLIATCCEPDLHPERTGQQAQIVQLLGEGVRPCVPRQTLRLSRRVEMTFAWIPPGSFLMGSPEGEEGREDYETLHQVTLTRGFWLAVTPVTQRQWKVVMGRPPSHCPGKDRPVEHVDWHDCQAFCNRLRRLEGKGFGLPTEAEWEYACRAGTTTPFFFGERLSTEQASYDGRASVGERAAEWPRQETTAVGCFPANAWGLFDMHGNVWEWCQDWYGADGTEAAQDPEGAARGEDRVTRGGSCHHEASCCRSAFRSACSPGTLYFVGFRPLFRPG